MDDHRGRLHDLGRSARATKTVTGFALAHLCRHRRYRDPDRQMHFRALKQLTRAVKESAVDAIGRDYVDAICSVQQPPDRRLYPSDPQSSDGPEWGVCHLVHDMGPVLDRTPLDGRLCARKPLRLELGGVFCRQCCVLRRDPYHRVFEPP